MYNICDCTLNINCCFYIDNMTVILHVYYIHIQLALHNAPLYMYMGILVHHSAILGIDFG